MSKLKALTLSILYAALTALFYAMNNMLFMVVAAVLTLLFFSIWYHKFHRDYELMRHALKEENTAPQTQQRSFDGDDLVPPTLQEK